MDRLDTWLNAQRGWRRFALLVLEIGPLCVLLAFSVVGFFSNRLPPIGLAFAGIIAVGLAMAAAISFLQLWSHRRRDRNGRKNWAPLVTWRGLVYNPVFGGPLLLITLTINATPEWHRQHQGAVHIAIFIFMPCFFFVMIERSRYQNRLRDRQRYYVS